MWPLYTFVSVCSLISGVITRSIVIEVKSVDFDFNPDVIQNMSVSLVALNNRKVINGSFVTKNDLMLFDLTTTLKVPQTKTTYFNLTISGCDFVEQKFLKIVSLSGLVVNNIRKSIKNLPDKCPIKELTEVVISNLYIDTDLLPAYIPQIAYDVTVTLSARSVRGFSIYVKGLVMPKRKISG